MEVVSFLYLKPFSCKLGLKCDFQNWTFAPMSNNLSCKNTLPAQKLLLYYEKHQIYSFPRFGSFRRTLLYLLHRNVFGMIKELIWNDKRSDLQLRRVMPKSLCQIWPIGLICDAVICVLQLCFDIDISK